MSKNGIEWNGELEKELFTDAAIESPADIDEIVVCAFTDFENLIGSVYHIKNVINSVHTIESELYFAFHEYFLIFKFENKSETREKLLSACLENCGRILTDVYAAPWLYEYGSDIIKENAIEALLHNFRR